MSYLKMSLGDTLEEKWMNIQSIKRIRNWFKKFVIFVNVFAAVVFIMAILGGSMEMEGVGVIGAIVVLLLMLVCNYFFTVYIYGTIFAWGLYG